MTPRDPQSLLPLTPAMFHVMVALADGPTHGYAIMKEVERLTDRELEVFELIGQGRGTREIAEQLRLSVSTVETHRAHLKEKLELDSATELVRRAVEWVSGREKRMALDK